MKFIDIFAGMGTVRMGFEQAGHECVYSIEWDKHKRKIYGVIFGHEPEGSDIRRVRADELPDADCWTFGFPCQDISVAGKQLGFNGHRSSLFFAVTKLIRDIPEESKPSYLLAENVKNFLSVNDGYDFLKALIELDEIGYDCEWQLLNSKDFGVPQNRERVFIVGHLRGRSARKVFPLTRQGNKYSTVGKSTETAVARTLTCGAHSGGNHSGMTIIQEPIAIDMKAIYPDSTRGNPVRQKHSPCLDHNCNIATIQNTKIRRLTPRECMRLQGVPDYITDKLIEAGISDTQLYRAAGDACTVNVIYEIASRMSTEEGERQ